MIFAHFSALAVFATYFILIIGLLYLVLNSIRNQAANQPKVLKTTWTFGLLTTVSFAHTWFHMIRFLLWSFRTYEASAQEPPGTNSFLFRLGSWLLETSLFEQAWAAVSFGSFNWWWSQQLCLFTVGAWTIFLAVQGATHRVQHIWAYMLLGQLVAISVASNLFYLSIQLSMPKSPNMTKGHKPNAGNGDFALTPPTIYIPVLVSFATIAYSPYTSIASGTFLPNLLFMHISIMIPLLLTSASLPWLPAIRLRTLAALLSTLSLLLHARSTLVAFSSVHLSPSNPADWRLFAATAWEVLNDHHPAQSSIGWDVVWTTVSFIAWATYGDTEASNRRSLSNFLLLCSTPLLSAGAVAPLKLKISDEDRARVRKDT